MATLEERIQNLTQEVNPSSGAIPDRGMEMFSNDESITKSSELPELDNAIARDVMKKVNLLQSTGAVSNRELDNFIMSVKNLPMTEISKSLNAFIQGLQQSGRLMSETDREIAMKSMPSNPMQPLVDLGFGEQVNIILNNPADSIQSKDAQQSIINELGTGMDIDGFLMEVRKLAPKGAIMSNKDMQGIMSMMGRDGDTALGHLTEGEVVIPAPVLEANPQASDMLENTMMDMGIDPRTRVVDSTGELGGIASINPNTGLQEFGFLSKIFKKVKNVVKKAAPILPFIPGVGTALGTLGGSLASKVGLGKVASGVGSLVSRVPGLSGVGGALSAAGTTNMPLGAALRSAGTSISTGIGGLFEPGNIFRRSTTDQGSTPQIIKTIGNQFGLGGRSQVLENAGYSQEEIDALKSQGDAVYNAEVQKVRQIGEAPQYDENGDLIPSQQRILNQGGMGMGGKFALAGLAGLLGKLAYEEQKKQKGVPLTPLTTMDALGRYNIASEIARRTNEEMPSRVEFGLTAEGLPALSGGMPRNVRDGGIMAFAQGGAVAMQEGGEPPIDMADFPRKNGEIDGPGTGTSDDIPAMLSDGEFVMTAKAVRNAGSYDMSSENGIVTLSPNGGSDREAGTRIMYKLMNHFENLA